MWVLEILFQAPTAFIREYQPNEPVYTAYKPNLFTFDFFYFCVTG